MRASHWFGWLLIASLIIGCANPQPPAPQDPYAVYRPALLEAYQEDLDGLPTLPQYKLSLQVDFDARTLRGEGSVLVPNPHAIPLSELYFRLYPNLPQYQGFLRIDTVSVAGKLASFDYVPDETSLHLLLDEPLPPEQTIEVQYTWQVKAPSIPSGYILFGERLGVIDLPLAYPILAAPAPDGTWRLDQGVALGDTLTAESSLYEAWVTVPPTLTLVSSAVVSSTRTYTNTPHVTYALVSGPAREFTLLLSPDHRVAERTVDGVQVCSYFLPGDEGAGNAALTYAAAALQVYSRHFAPYPFRKMDVAAAMLLNRGMEYPTLNMLGTDLYRRDRASLEFLTVHEVAHQWWYSQVGNDQVNEPWLDEGLAEYSTYFYYEDVYGQPVAERLLQNRWVIPVNYARGQGLDAPLGLPAFEYSSHNYETIVYGKGALFFDALRQRLGDARFHQALRAYLEQYKYRIATGADLQRVIEETSGESVDDLFTTWVRGG